MVEDRDDLLGDGRALLRASLAPSPRRRRDIGKDGDAERLRLRREPPVEVWVVDDQEEVGLFLAHRFDERLFELQETAEAQDDLPYAHEAVVATVTHEAHARLRHLGAAEAEELHLRLHLKHLPGEARAVQIA